MTIRVGVIGTGSIAKIGHLPFYQNNREVELIALVDTNLERAKETAQRFGAPHAYASLEEMLECEKVDAVSICTANNSHVPLALLALEHGVDVLVEKPLATDPKEAQKVVDAAKRNQRICMVGMTHRFRNEAQAMKRFTGAGDLGDIYFAKAQILRRRGTPAGWFTNRSVSGGGPLMDIGVHVLDLAWWLLGLPETKSISGQLVQGIGRYNTDASRWKSIDVANEDNQIFDVEDFASAYIRFQNGSVLQLEVSWALNGPQDDALKVNLYGTKGGLSLEPLCYYSEKNRILLESKLAVETNNPHESEISHFVEAVRNRTQPLTPVEQGLKIVEMLDGIVRSADQQKEIVFS